MPRQEMMTIRISYYDEIGDWNWSLVKSREEQFCGGLTSDTHLIVNPRSGTLGLAGCLYQLLSREPWWQIHSYYRVLLERQSTLEITIISSSYNDLQILFLPSCTCSYCILFLISGLSTLFPSF